MSYIDILVEFARADQRDGDSGRTGEDYRLESRELLSPDGLKKWVDHGRHKSACEVDPKINTKNGKLADTPDP